jgi:hypothetical protein
MLALLCEESFDTDEIKAAIAEGKEALIKCLRSNNMYPPAVYASRIAESVNTLFNQEDDTTAELMFDDKKLLGSVTTESLEFENQDEDVDLDLDEDSDDLDELLDGDDINIQNSSSLKIADDEAPEAEDET